MQSEYEECGSYGNDTLSVVGIGGTGRKPEEAWRKPGVNGVLVLPRFFSFRKNILDS